MIPPQLWVPIMIAVASLIVVPLVVAFFKKLREIYLEARLAKLKASFVTREEHDRQFEDMTKAQSVNHRENRDFLDTIRTEAQKREARLLGEISATRNDVREVHGRVDTLYQQLLGGGKR